MKLMLKAAVLAATLSVAYAAPALADDYPVKPGEYVEVSMVTIDDGHGLEYLNFLSGLWRRNQDYAKSQGWITGYEIMSNENKRPGEPDLILVTRFKDFANAAEGERRNQLMAAQTKVTDAEAEAASAGRAKFRHIIGSQLWRSMTWKN